MSGRFGEYFEHHIIKMLSSLSQESSQNTARESSSGADVRSFVLGFNFFWGNSTAWSNLCRLLISYIVNFVKLFVSVWLIGTKLLLLFTSLICRSNFYFETNHSTPGDWWRIERKDWTFPLTFSLSPLTEALSDLIQEINSSMRFSH